MKFLKVFLLFLAVFSYDASFAQRDVNIKEVPVNSAAANRTLENGDALQITTYLENLGYKNAGLDRKGTRQVKISEGRTTTVTNITTLNFVKGRSVYKLTNFTVKSGRKEQTKTWAQEVGNDREALAVVGKKVAVVSVDILAIIGCFVEYLVPIINNCPSAFSCITDCFQGGSILGGLLCVVVDCGINGTLWQCIGPEGIWGLISCIIDAF